MSKHTQGPWTASGEGRYYNVTADHGATSVAALGEGNTQYEEARANAQLIAAAPALLAALRGTLESLIVWQFQYDPDHTDDVTARCIESARAAIAQAEAR